MFAELLADEPHEDTVEDVARLHVEGTVETVGDLTAAGPWGRRA